MSDLWRRLNLRDRRALVVLDAPASFERHIAELDGITVARDLSSVSHADFLLGFVTSRGRVAAIAEGLTSAPPGDVTVWMAYPKASSRRYRCDFNPDSGWAPLGWAGFEVVSQVAIDDDWSALRFRRVEHIRSTARKPERALSQPRRGAQPAAAGAAAPAHSERQPGRGLARPGRGSLARLAAALAQGTAADQAEVSPDSKPSVSSSDGSTISSTGS